MAKETQPKRDSMANAKTDGDSYLGVKLDDLPEEILKNDGVSDDDQPRDQPARGEPELEAKSDPAPDDAGVTKDGEDEDDFEGESEAFKALRRKAKESEDARKKAEEENEKLRKETVSTDVLKLQSLKTQVDAAHVSTVSTIDKLTAEIANLKAARRTARNEGDEDQEEELEDKLAAARISLQQQEAIKVRIEQDQKKVDHHMKVVQERVATETEESDVTRGLSVAAKAWVKEHPLFETDEEYRQVCVLADTSARKKGIAPDSREYFKHIEGMLAKHYPDEEPDGAAEEDDVVDDADDKPKKDAVPPVKRPQSFGAPGRSGARGESRKGQPYLTKDQKEMALISGFEDTPESLREYWDNLPDNQRKRR